MQTKDVAPDDFTEDATDSRRYASLERALQLRRIPLENHALIRRFVAALEITEFYGTSSYIRAVRASGGPDVRIASGWSNGFLSEQEVLSVAGDVGRWLSNARKSDNLWGLDHPKNGGGRLVSSKADSQRDYGTCPECTMTFRANGTCSCG